MRMAIGAAVAGFFAGAGALRGVERWREHKTAPAGLSELVGWLHLVGPSTILQKNGSFLTGWSYRGPDLAAATPAELNALSAHLNDALLPYGDGWMFHFDSRRRAVAGYAPPGAFPDPVTRLIDAERRSAYESSRRHFVSESFLCATYLPPREIYSRLGNLFIHREGGGGGEGGEGGAGGDRGQGGEEGSWAGALAAFEAEAAQLKVARLAGGELLNPRLGMAPSGMSDSLYARKSSFMATSKPRHNLVTQNPPGAILGSWSEWPGISGLGCRHRLRRPQRRFLSPERRTA
ncbi:MAG TPA: hypothetical protein VHR45_09180 [Thermoanaerobaculia bacterium]|nr:hypothetical protein [Thermoanaerobaculia bacterium]